MTLSRELFVNDKISAQGKENRYAMSKEMNNLNLVPLAAAYASATLASCQSSLPMLRAKPSMPCVNARLMSKRKVRVKGDQGFWCYLSSSLQVGKGTCSPPSC